MATLFFCFSSAARSIARPSRSFALREAPNPPHGCVVSSSFSFLPLLSSLRTTRIAVVTPVCPMVLWRFSTPLEQCRFRLNRLLLTEETLKLCNIVWILDDDLVARSAWTGDDSKACPAKVLPSSLRGLCTEIRVAQTRYGVRSE